MKAVVTGETSGARPPKAGNSVSSLVGVAAIAVLGFLGVVLFASARMAGRKNLVFDDAFMFARYAAHMHAGLGVSWNWDGVPTHGETSPAWGLIIYLSTFLPVHAAMALALSSALATVGAVFACAWAVVRCSRRTTRPNLWIAAGAIALGLSLDTLFLINALNGMETMFSAAILAIYCGMAVAWSRAQVSGIWVAMLGILLYLSRPEAVLAAVLLPILLCALQPLEGTGARTWRELGVVLLGMLAGIALWACACRLYFGAALPLAFYIKVRRGYVGYERSWHPLGMAITMIWGCRLYLVALALFARARDWRLLLTFLLPFGVCAGYLLTVTQIMGYLGRYYIPYFPFLAILALLVVSRRLAEGRLSPFGSWRAMLRLAVCVTPLALLGVLASVVKGPLITRLDRRIERRDLMYAPTVFQVHATRPLPDLPEARVMTALTDDLASRLPKGTVIASTEVGYLGAGAPQIDIIDLAGLNDTGIALHGFHVDALLGRRPDIIWMPHPDYTLQRGIIFSDPRLLPAYDVYVGAADYGVAVRKDSPVHDLATERLRAMWADLYPGSRMEDYLAQSARWSGDSFPARSETEADAAKRDRFEASSR